MGDELGGVFREGDLECLLVVGVGAVDWPFANFGWMFDGGATAYAAAEGMLPAVTPLMMKTTMKITITIIAGMAKAGSSMAVQFKKGGA